MNRVYYGYDVFSDDLKILLEKVKDYDADIILSIARGGLTIGHLLGEALNNRNVFALNSVHYDETHKLDTIEIFNVPDLGAGKRILIVDDIVDSGDTMKAIVEMLKDKYPENSYKSASIFYKKESVLKPDFYVKEAKAWIDFFWSVDLK